MAEKTNSRSYHVLQREGSVIAHLAVLEAASAEQAIRLAAADHGAARYIAVPDRSWTEITVKVETPAPRIILEAEKAPEVPAPIPGQTSIAPGLEALAPDAVLGEDGELEEEQPLTRAAQRQAKV